MKCPLCNTNNFTSITQKVRFGKTAEVISCKDCSLIMLNQDSLEFNENFYRQEYHQTYLTHIEPDALDPEKYYTKMINASKPWIEKIIQGLTGNETVLDMGCSTGHIIKGLQNHVKKIYGYEINKKEVEFCREKLGLEVTDNPLNNSFNHGEFDIILLIFVLEHIADPITFLKDLKKFLKQQGKFLILVPNAEDALMTFYQIDPFTDFYYCIEHLFYYTPLTVSQLFKKTGLYGSIKRVQEYPITNHLQWGYLKRPSDTLASREFIPNISIKRKDVIDKWDILWQSFNTHYREFLLEIGCSDRIWCEVSASDNQTK